jgi:hypothetical protein
VFIRLPRQWAGDFGVDRHLSLPDGDVLGPEGADFVGVRGPTRAVFLDAGACEGVEGPAREHSKGSVPAL